MSVTLQKLSDCGLNPFAAQLLVESYLRHPNKKPVAFELSGVIIALDDAEAVQRAFDQAKAELAHIIEQSRPHYPAPCSCGECIGASAALAAVWKYSFSAKEPKPNDTSGG